MKDIIKDFSKSVVRFGCYIIRLIAAFIRLLGSMFNVIGAAFNIAGEWLHDKAWKVHYGYVKPEVSEETAA